MNAEEKNRCFQELTLNLQHEGFAIKPETEEGLLPIELDGQRLCLALDTGPVRYWREDTADDHRSAALDKAISITKTTAEYMRQMETAPQLTASGLTGDYRLLADFNGVVLAGHSTQFGVQFITWAWVRERTGLNAGNCYGPPGGVDSYTAAKRDFATRSGLIPHSALFAPEQLTEIYRCIHETLENFSITSERQEHLSSAAEQIERTIPDLEDRVDISLQNEEEFCDLYIPQNPAAMKLPPHGAILRHQAVLLLPTIPQLWVASCVLASFRNKTDMAYYTEITQSSKSEVENMEPPHSSPSSASAVKSL